MRPIRHALLPAGMTLVLAVDFFVVSQGSVTTPVSRERALDRFRASPSATSGWESIDLAGARHDYPEESFASVRLANGCRWQIEHRVIVDVRDRAPRRMEALAGVAQWQSSSLPSS